MPAKRTIISLREDERNLMRFAITHTLKNLPNAPGDTTPGQGIAILKTNLEKLYKKLEEKL